MGIGSSRVARLRIDEGKEDVVGRERAHPDPERNFGRSPNQGTDKGTKITAPPCHRMKAQATLGTLRSAPPTHKKTAGRSTVRVLPSARKDRAAGENGRARRVSRFSEGPSRAEARGTIEDQAPTANDLQA